ncbi:hypothetical protein Tco_0229688, partial [Tanacetum coccineum]
SSSAPTARPTRGFRAYYGFVFTLDDEIRREPERESMDASGTARSETQMAALQSQQRPTGDPAHHDVPEEAGSSS